MSDFTSGFWSIYIGSVTVIGILACLLLLWATSKTRVPPSDDNTTGHVWDGDLREMNNPLPRWWAGLFVITIVFALAYLVLYPGLGSNQGTLGWTSAVEHKQDVDEGNAQIAPLYARFAGIQPEDGGRRASFHEQLRAMPWLGCRRQQGHPQPDRQGLAAWGRASPDP
jgi:cytochrome c oxidase cbb3-type subunit III